MDNANIIWTLFFLICASGLTLTAVVRENEDSCSPSEVRCSDGLCVSADRICDGIADCVDRKDEALCGGVSTLLSLWNPEHQRSKRQAAKCRKNQWQCRDTSCISFDGKCDGIVDCPDGSDETFPLCRKEKCQYNWFRCTYGACVDGTAPCNGIQECADNSDELLPRCRNETDEIQGRFRCSNGDMIPAASHCDGVVDCADGSDETVRACAAKTCPSYLFQCAYGACADQGSDCNDVQDCADNSDESDELCNRISAGTTTTTTAPSPSGNCILPPYPAHGGYTVQGAPFAVPGQGFKTVTLTVTCNPGYGLEGGESVLCFDGFWVSQLPKCIRYCKLPKHPSVEYRCLLRDNTGVEGSRPCREFEPTGTVVQPLCRAPNYYATGTLGFMRCIEDSWDYIAVCSPECGRITPEGEFLIIEGRNAKRGELPWHTGIYTKATTPYMQICGGSLVRTNVVISAAHCFWDDVQKQRPASRYAVAAGKLYRPWGDQVDVDAQKSDVKEIHIPPRFQGAASNFQDDIAMVILEIEFEYKVYIRPVCMDFGINFDRLQLSEGNIGKVAGWGLTAANGNASQILKVVDLPYVKIEKCIAQSPPGFREYITSDKICAGYGNGTALCKGDSGGGLAFPELDRGIERYYLRGIVSTAPSNENLCNANTLTSFTQIVKHEHFIKEYL